MTIMQGARMAAHEISASLRRYWPCQVQWDSLNSFASICKGVERRLQPPCSPEGDCSRYLREYPRNVISKMPLPDGSESGCKYNQF